MSESSLLALAIRRPIGVTMILLACLLFGFVGYSQLPVTLLPDLSYPTVTVRTEFPGSSPEDVEDRIGEPIREAVSVLPGVVRVTSVSKAGQSDVIIEFAWGTEMIYAVPDVREKIDRVFLPSQAETPLILRYDPSLDPVMILGLSGPLSTMDLRQLAEDEIERDLTKIDGIAAVKVKGGDEREILIAVDPTRLTAFDLDIREIAQKIGAENLNASAGILEEGQTEYLVRALNEFRNLEDIENLIVARKGGTNIYLKDLAKVRVDVKEKEVITRIDGKPAVLLEIFKQADANLVELSNRIQDKVLGTAEQLAYVERARHAPKKTPGKVDSASQKSASQKSASEKSASKKSGPKKSSQGKGGEGDPRWRKMRDAQQRQRLMTNFINFRLPPGVKARVLTNPAKYIEGSIDEVKSAGILGGLLAVLVIYLFLRKGKPTFLISLAIPTSILITFAPLYATGVSLNVMSLGGLALGIGMLVDTSIVVLESIQRCRDQGMGLQESALSGVSQVSSAVVASTLTTIAVFLPIVFVTGIAGQLFRDQALAVVFSLLASLVISLFFIPMLAARGEKGAPPPPAPQSGPVWWRTIKSWVNYAWGILLMLPILGLTILQRALSLLFLPAVKIFGLTYEPLASHYPGLLRKALAHRPLILVATLLLSALAVFRVGHLGSEVMPEVHEGEFQALLFFPRDLDVESTDLLARPLEKKIRELDGVASSFLVSGVARDELKSSEEGPHSARIHLVLRPGVNPLLLENQVRDEVRSILAKEPTLQGSRFETPTLVNVRSPISVEIYGHDLRRLAAAKAQVMHALEDLPTLRDVRSTLNRGNVEVVIRFDREELSQYGLDIGSASQRLSSMVQGEVPTRFTEGDRKVDMRVRLSTEELGSLKELSQLNLAGKDQAPVYLSSVAEFKYLEGPSEIRRIGNRRAAEVQATPLGLDLGKNQRAVEDRVAALDLGPGITWKMGGQSEEMESTKRSMTGALLLAIFLVYVVMAVQFESLIQPFIILFTVPLALIGVIFTLDLMGIPLSVVVFIGVILLAGIVVNNAIVLIDRINQDRENGSPLLEAVVSGSATRLRPVLMTTVTTVLGLLPLTGLLPNMPWLGISGEGLELRAPMALAVISGLVFSTLLTLVVIPVVYSLAAGREQRR